MAETLSRTEGHVLAVATAGALLSLLPVAAHQLGVLKHLPDPHGALFDSDGITESKAAHPFGIPDGLVGLGSYGLTFVLVMLARRDRRAERALALKLAADGAAAGFNVARQVVSCGRLCSWCTATALCTAVMVTAGSRLITSSVREAIR